jgi:uncharacterized protein YdeI (BOF family)
MNQAMCRHFIIYACNAALFLMVAGGCAQQQSTRGKVLSTPDISVAMVRAATPVSMVSVRGTMVEKCPVAGCWFKLHDSTGTVQVDTKTAGFTVTDLPLQSTIVVSGKVVQRGSQKIIQASGIRY